MKGKVLGSRYRILEYIAQGGFGTTYLAEDTQLPGKDRCVVKQLSPSSENPEFLAVARRLFKSEADALHNLGHHDCIPQLLAYFEENDMFFLVQQYVEGATLDQELEMERPWPEVKVVQLLQNCLDILSIIHAQGVIHRDIKPANLIRRYSDQKIVLVDFGTVKNLLYEQTGSSQRTVAVGTQGYMPSEQAQGNPRHTSDIYALGMIGIEALTNIELLEIEEDDQGELLWAHLTNASSQLVEILSKMTRCNFQERYQSAREVVEALTLLSGARSETVEPVVQSEAFDTQAETVAASAISGNQTKVTSVWQNTQASPQKLSFSQKPAQTKQTVGIKLDSSQEAKRKWSLVLALGAVLGIILCLIIWLTSESILQLETSPEKPSTPRLRQEGGFREDL